MNPWTLRAIVAALATSACACASAPSEEEAPLIEEPLTLTIDAVDVAHGGLRFAASTTDAPRDVNVRLGEPCGGAPVGGGFAARDALVWTLGRDELGRALACDLVVEARDGRVRRTARVTVAAVLSPDGDDGPALALQAGEGSTTRLRFKSERHLPHLAVAGTIVGAEEDGEDDTTDFVVDDDDLARALLVGRPLVVGGHTFTPTVQIGGAVLSARDGTEVVEEPVVLETIDVPGEADEGEPIED